MSLTIGQNICQSLFNASFCEQYSGAALSLGGGLLIGAGALALKLIQSPWSTPATPISSKQVSENPKQTKLSPLEKFTQLLKENGFELTKDNQLEWDKRYMGYTGYISASYVPKTDQQGNPYIETNEKAEKCPMMWGKDSHDRHFFTFRLAYRKDGKDSVETTAFTVFQRDNSKFSILVFSNDAPPFFQTGNIYVSGYGNSERKILKQFAKFIRGEACEQNMSKYTSPASHYLDKGEEEAKYSFWLDKEISIKKSALSE